MQAPTPDSDNNPYHVFRQRAKPNKPQTRRRRETQEESLEKLRSIHDNLSQALSIAEMVRDREVKKTRLTVRFAFCIASQPKRNVKGKPPKSHTQLSI